MQVWARSGRNTHRGPEGGITLIIHNSGRRRGGGSGGTPAFASVITPCQTGALRSKAASGFIFLDRRSSSESTTEFDR